MEEDIKREIDMLQYPKIVPKVHELSRINECLRLIKVLKHKRDIGEISEELYSECDFYLETKGTDDLDEVLEYLNKVLNTNEDIN